jgi:hypothetical protein
VGKLKHASIVLALLALLAAPAAAQQTAKISVLPPASTPFAGSELLYIVQGGASKQTSYSTFVSQFAQFPLALANGTTATTQTLGDNSNKVATDAFVAATVTGGTIPSCPSLLNSPVGALTCITVLAGGVTATTQPTGDASAKVATDLFVVNQFNANLGYNAVAAGMDPTDTNDNSTIMNTLLTNVANGGIIYFPCGTFKMNVTISTTIAAGKHITIDGGGSDCTVLHFPNVGAGLELFFADQFSSFSSDGITWATAQANEVDPAITLAAAYASPNTNEAVSANNAISNSVFRGFDGYAVADYWSFGMDLVGVSNITLTNNWFWGANTATPAGTGVRFRGTGSTNYAVVMNVAFSTFAGLGVGAEIAGFTQAEVFTSDDFVESNYGIHVSSGLSGINQYLTVVNSQFSGLFVAGISELSPYIQQTISNNLFLPGDSQTGIVEDGDFFTITGGNQFIFSGSTTPGGAVNVTGASGFGVIADNLIQGMLTGVTLGSSTADVTLGNNGYYNNTQNFNNLGTGNDIGTSCSGTPNSSFKTVNGLTTGC